MNATADSGPRAWTGRHWGTLAALVFLAQVALVITFGARKPPPVVIAKPAPRLRLAAADDAFIALGDPTLFALPHPNDFAADKRLQTPELPAVSFRAPEPAGWLPLATNDLLNSYREFMRTNPFAENPLDFKPEPAFNSPAAPVVAAAPPHSTLSLRGELAQRALLHPLDLPDQPAGNLIAPSKTQVLVDASGRVISAVLLPPDYVPDYLKDAAMPDASADQRALTLARAARFAPAAQATWGQMIFNWRVVPLPASSTNAPPKTP